MGRKECHVSAPSLSSGDAPSVAALCIRNADFEPEKFPAMKRALRRRRFFTRHATLAISLLPG